MAAAYRLAPMGLSLFDEVRLTDWRVIKNCAGARHLTLTKLSRLLCLVQGLMAQCLPLCEALLEGGAACAISAKKLALVLHSVFHQAPRSASKNGEHPWVSS